MKQSGETFGTTSESQMRYDTANFERTLRIMFDGVTTQKLYELQSENGICVGNASAKNIFVAPISNERPSDRRKREARAAAFCTECNVQLECIEYGIRTDDRIAYMGNMNAKDRTELIKIRKKSLKNNQ